MSAPAEAEAAVAAIDALLERWAGTGPTRPDRAGSTHVHATDAEGEWLVVTGPAGRAVTREHAKGDVALRGPATALLAVLRGEVPPSPPPPGVEVFGDHDALHALVRSLDASR